MLLHSRAQARTLGLVLSAALLCFSAGCSYVGGMELSGKIPNGTKVDDLDLSGLNSAEGQVKLKEWAKGKLAENRLLVYNETEIPARLSDIGVGLAWEKTWERVRHAHGQAVASVLSVDLAKSHEFVEKNLKHLAKPAQDAIYRIEEDEIKITPAVNGQEVSAEALAESLQRQALGYIPQTISLTMRAVLPAMTTEEAQTLAFDGVVGEFSTRFAAEDKNRSANLAIAAQALDKKLLFPGEVFSFNDTVGPRTVQNGYQEAKVIINNDFVKGSGGGVCQVSTTLYNAVLLANLPVMERMPHAVAVAYVPPGQDATVNYPNIDFKFWNNTQSMAYIRTKVKAGELKVKIYGKKTGRTVRLEHLIESEEPFTVEKQPDPSLPQGKVVVEQVGTKGYKVKTWRIVREQTGEELRQFLSRDEYKPASRILRVGSRDTM